MSRENLIRGKKTCKLFKLNKLTGWDYISSYVEREDAEQAAKAIWRGSGDDESPLFKVEDSGNHFFRFSKKLEKRR